MTVWAFGDSFVDSYIKHGNYKLTGYKGITPWLQAVGNSLNQRVMNFGCCGSSVEYSFIKFNEVRNEIENNDIVIFALTSLDRRWFLKDNPSKSVINSNSILETYSENQKEAVKNYLLYLEHEEIQYTYLENFIENLNYLTKKLNLHTILIPCMYIEHEILKEHKHLYPNIHIPLGFLSNINYKQYCGKYHKKMMKTFVEDGLVNHLIWSNHVVLRDKILKNIESKEPINLEKGFHENVITNKTYNSDLIKKEFSTTPIY